MKWEKLTKAYLDNIENLRTVKVGPQLPDWPYWNNCLGGLQENQYTIFCGPTGAGKTTFLANVSAQLIREGVQQFILSVETGRHDYITRVMCAMSGENLRVTEPVPEAKLAAWHAQYGHHFAKDTMHVSVYETRCKVEVLMDDIREQVQKFGCKFVVIDNLNYFMDVTSAANAVVEMDRVTHALIEFVKSVPVHLVMVMHPKKTDGGRIESEFDIKGSSTAVQEAHNVLLFNRPPKELIDAGKCDRNWREIYFAKLRKRGQHQGDRLFFRNLDSVKYDEMNIIRP